MSTWILVSGWIAAALFVGYMVGYRRGQDSIRIATVGCPESLDTEAGDDAP